MLDNAVIFTPLSMRRLLPPARRRQLPMTIERASAKVVQASMSGQETKVGDVVYQGDVVKTGAGLAPLSSRAVFRVDMLSTPSAMRKN